MAIGLKKRIDDLRDTLETNDSFSVTIDKLFSLADSDEFVDMGEIKEDEMLSQVVAQVVQQLVTSPEDVHLQLVYIEEYGFYHGSIIVGQTPGVLLYFESIRMGMIALPKNFEGDVSYLRFSADILTEGTFPGRIPSYQND